jgi:16S rRNA (guanine527-N7)-methyltransferase
MSSPAHDVAGDAELVAALAESQRLGMLGDRPVADVIEHAGAFVLALAEVTGTVVDLGSGGGVPGLVIARARPDLRLILVDRRSSRTDHLQRLVARLHMADRIEVLTVDATTLGERRGGIADAVVSRGFGAPPTTLRAAAPLVRAGGLVVVSEPPRPKLGRWPLELLDQLGLVATAHADRRVVVFRRPDLAQPEAGPGGGALRPNP